MSKEPDNSLTRIISIAYSGKSVCLLRASAKPSGLELSIVLFVYINWIRGNQDKVLSIASKFSKGIREIQSDYIAGQLVKEQ